MAYSDAEIRDYANQLEQKGAPATEIEAFVSSAKADQGQAASSPEEKASIIAAQRAMSGIQKANAEMSAPDFTKALQNAKTPQEKQAIVVAQGRPSSEGSTSLGGQVGRELAFGPRMAAKWLFGHKGEGEDVALRALGPAIGQRFAGTPGRIIGGPVGELAAQANAIAQGRQQEFQPGQIAGSAIAQFGSKTPGPVNPATMVKNAATYAGANVAGQGAGTLIDQGRLLTGQETMNAANAGALSAGVEALTDTGKSAQRGLAAQVRDSAVNQIVEEARGAGIKILPSKVNPTAVNRALEFIGGRAQTVEDMRLRNEDVARSLALKELGRPQIAPSIQAEIEIARNKASIPYSKIESIADRAAQAAETLKSSQLTADDYHEFGIKEADPAYVKKLADLTKTASADIQSWRSQRQAEKIYWRAFDDPNYSGDRVAMQEKAIAAGKSARELEDKIADMTSHIGQPELYDELKQAQVIYAKSHEIENALVSRDAPDMTKIGRSKAELSGDLKTMADVGREFPKTSGNTRGQGYGDKQSMVRQGISVATKPVRSFLMSDFWQKYGTAPSYNTGPDFTSQVARAGTSALGRNGNPFLTPIPKSTDQAPNNPFLQNRP